MTLSHFLHLGAIGVILSAWSAASCFADFDDSTLPTATKPTAPSTVQHKTSHRKKKKSTTSEISATGKKVVSATEATTSRKKSRLKSHPTASAAIPTTPPPPTVAPVTVTKPNGSGESAITISAPPESATHASAGPEVETGLPVARHGGANPDAYRVASAFPVSPVVSSVDSYASVERAKNPLEHFTFTDFARHRAYPWRINILTTVFWIGEGSTPVSSTDNMASAWDPDWRDTNGGSDAPGENRQGYMPAHHAARTNPFYVALPFNDLKFPDKAREWLPTGWYRKPKDGKQVSACQHRWLEIKNAQGDTCYAQWEDVGPLNYSDADYVFGGSRPIGLGGDHAGLDISPAVADYLNITGRNCLTRWRFVDDADVVPGKWLKYDEEAVIFRAMHALKGDDPARILPIQRATSPIDDETDLDSNKKRLGAAKG